MNKNKISNIENLIGQDINLIARLKKKRKSGKNLTFLLVGDHSGNVQAVYEGNSKNLPKNESVIKINGKVANNENVRSGIPGLEIIINNYDVISPCCNNLDFDSEKLPKERKKIIKNRGLFLRNKESRSVFELKSVFLKSCRDFFDDNGFVEIQSPAILGSSIEGPVNAFEVNYFGEQAYLSLSNMLYHSMLISGDMEKIYEIGKLFRQDKSSSSIHLSEFNILDYSFANSNRFELMELTENLINKNIDELRNAGAEVKIENQQSFPIVEYGELLDYLNNNGCDIKWGEFHQVPKGYSNLIRERWPSFFWLIDQPIEAKSFFTADRIGDDGKEVCNDFQLWYAENTNLADGSERIINYEEARQKIKSKGLSEENFSHYLKSISQGQFPYAGCGLGLERLFMTLMGVKNIRDVVLFPRDMRNLDP